MATGSCGCILLKNEEEGECEGEGWTLYVGAGFHLPSSGSTGLLVHGRPTEPQMGHGAKAGHCCRLLCRCGAREAEYRHVNSRVMIVDLKVLIGANGCYRVMLCTRR